METILDEKIREKIKRIKLLILDVDGVLTDGKVIIDDEGKETKHFNVRDGHGLKMLMRYGIEIVFLTGRRSMVVERRARELGISEVHQGAKNKLSFYSEIVERRKLAGDEVGYIGDDIVDIPFMKHVGFCAAVADAAPEVLQIADYIAGRAGGEGAVREICDMILKVQGKWRSVAERYELD